MSHEPCSLEESRSLRQHDRIASQVLYGMDYLSSERDRQHAFLRSAVLDHLRRAPAALLVIEEYDKLDCPTRAMLRQLIGSSRASNTSMARYASISTPQSRSGCCLVHILRQDV